MGDRLTLGDVLVMAVGLGLEAVALFWHWLLLALICGGVGFLFGRSCR